MKNALLVASFGTTHPETLEKNIVPIERDMAAAFPGWTVRRAFTSGKVIHVWNRRDGKQIDTVDEALARLVEEGFERTIVQPTHILNGEELEKLEAQAMPYKERFKGLAVGKPLLASLADQQATARILLEVLPAPEPDRAVVLMGHGTAHFSNAAYAQLEYVLHDLGRADVFIGTVEGYPALEQVQKRVASRKAKAVTLLPLMVVAGEHAANDMAGDGSGSWKKRFEAAGCAVDCVIRGLGELPAIRALFVEHARGAVKALNGE